MGIGREDGEGGKPLRVGALVAVRGECVAAKDRVGNGFGAGEQAARGGASGGKGLQPVATGGARKEARGTDIGEALATGKEHRGLGSQSRTRQPRRIVVDRVGSGTNS